MTARNRVNTSTYKAHTRRSTKLHDLDLHFHAETDKAILISENGEERHAVWLPKSQIEYEDDGRGSCKVTLPEWLANEHGLI